MHAIFYYHRVILAPHTNFREVNHREEQRLPMKGCMWVDQPFSNGDKQYLSTDVLVHGKPPCRPLLHLNEYWQLYPASFFPLYIQECEDQTAQLHILSPKCYVPLRVSSHLYLRNLTIFRDPSSVVLPILT